MKHRIKGFTAIELMVVIAIVAILASLALPSFQHIIARLQMEKDMEAFRASMFVARSEAMKRGGNIELRKLNAAATGLPSGTCATAEEWSCGWQIVDVSTSSPAVIRQYPSKGKNNITVTSGSSNVIALNRWGTSNAGAQISVQHKTMPGTDFSKAMCLSSGGALTTKESIPC